MKINCTKGTPEQMIAQFKKKIDELEGADINSSFVYPEDMEALEEGDYESHATEPINASEMNVGRKEEILQFLANKGFDTSSIEVQNYTDAVAEYLDMCEEAWHNTGERFSYGLSDWYSDTLQNYPDELADLPMVGASEDEIADDLDPIYSDGEDWSIEYDGPEADDTSEFDEDEYNEWSEMPNVIDFELVDQKYVNDMDGFSTMYSMYRDLDDPEHFVFVFGDPDIYSPDDGNWDWECNNEAEAYEWFESYTGFDEEEDEY